MCAQGTTSGGQAAGLASSRVTEDQLRPQTVVRTRVGRKGPGVFPEERLTWRTLNQRRGD